MKSSDIVAYDYRTERYCPNCIAHRVESDPRYDGWQVAEGINLHVEDNLDELAAAFGIDRTDEQTFDTEEFPKVVFADQITEDNDFCASCEDAILAVC